MMDPSRTDVESCALLKHARGCKVTLLVALQNVLLTGCLLSALYVYWISKDKEPEHIVSSVQIFVMGTENTHAKYYSGNISHTNGAAPNGEELKTFPEDVHIWFTPISDIFGNTTVKFEHVKSQNQMDFSDWSRISTKCRGPYVWHMYVCYLSFQGQANGTLELQVAGSTDPVSTVHLQAHDDSQVCRGLQTLTYLSNKEEVTLRLYSENFKIKEMTVGFNYLLSKCDY
ncbi:hypothetical protein WMY93_024525 [Mugilogobius chulae]|uniref:TNF family profile domain-containing protein n=1 Tax=Mugilogobius chulae TaxID=88201 RepID=A0AAW0NA79_9GOBI